MGYYIKTFDELTFCDDFLFGNVMSDEKLCKELLEIILGVKIRKIKYPEGQKSIKITRGSKGIRLDVYLNYPFQVVTWEGIPMHRNPV